MRRISLGVAVATLILTSAQAFALVAPGPGVLPDFDVRKDAFAKGDPSSGGLVDGVGPTRLHVAVAEPTAGQLAAVRRIRAGGVADLQVSFGELNGLPRTLHSYGKPLSGPSTQEPVEVAREYLRANQDIFQMGDAEIDELVVARDADTHDIFTTVWLAQMVDGILVDQGAFRFNIDQRGQVIWVASGEVTPGIEAATEPMLSAADAVVQAAQHIGVQLEAAPRQQNPSAESAVYFDQGPFLSDIRAELRIIPSGSGRGLLAWQVMLEPAGGYPAYYAISVDARAGRLLKRTNMMNYFNQGLAFNGGYPNTVTGPLFPAGVPQTLQNFGYRWPSTAGWSTPAPWGQYRYSIGNNVEAREDWAGDNETTLGVMADGGVSQLWLFPFMNYYATSPGTTYVARRADAKRDASAVITNLWFWNNKWHDFMHGLGFTEAYGNFQFDNFSRGGCATDAVRADAFDNMDGGSTNNANFGTPPEPIDCSGSFRPRMQQFITVFGSEAAPTYRGDTSLDTDVVIHEYSHGTSHRLVGGAFVGGLGAPQSGAMGEGWGDWYSASYFDDPIAGQYSFNGGLRQFPMNANPRTYADADFAYQVHADGEIWASTLWDMRRETGKNVAEQLVTDGMKFSVADPSMPDMRDAILMADQVRYGGLYKCRIWGAFLPRGMGYEAGAIDANIPISDFVFNAPACSGFAHVKYESHLGSDKAGGNDDGLYSEGETIDLTVNLNNFDGVATAVGVVGTLSTTTAGITVVGSPTRAYPNIPKGAVRKSAVPFQFAVGPGYVCGAPIQWNIAISWSPGLSRVAPFTDTEGSEPGVTIFGDGAEGTPLSLIAPMGVASAYGHASNKSYYTLDGCWTGTPETACDSVHPCNGTCAGVQLPRMSLPSKQAAMLSFWVSNNAETDWDGVYVEVSTDNGSTWEFVDTINYTGSIPSQGNGCFPGDYRGINGPPTQAALTPWTQFTGDLGKYAGMDVVVAFRNHQDGCVVFEGAFIDDIAMGVRNCTAGQYVTTYISGKTNNDNVNAACSDIDDSPDPGETVAVTLSITNSGSGIANATSARLVSLNPLVTVDPTTATQALGNVAAGATASGVWRYTVAAAGVSCFEDASFRVEVSANGGAYREDLTFAEVLKKDNTTGAFFDDFEGGSPAWSATLGPDGSANDWGIRELNCLTAAGNRFFWATNLGMVPATCSTGEPDYSADSDSVLTSPLIDLGAPGMKLLTASWDSFGVNQTQADGSTQILIDHDNDGTFTLIQDVPGGLGGTSPAIIDIQNNPLGVPIPPTETARYVQFQLRFRALSVDPGATGNSVGMIVNDFQLDWQRCDVTACVPGLSDLGGSGRPASSVTLGGIHAGASQP